MLAEKQLYLCSSCKKTGVKSYKSKVFESFFCPKCKKDTTLFLPPSKIKEIKRNEEKNIIPMNSEIQEIQEVQDSALIYKEYNHNRTGFSLRDVVTFLIGFIAALLIMKYS